LPAGFTTNVVDASTVQILQGATVVLTITLNNETGAFNVVQNNPIDHPAGSNENNLQFSIGVEVEDSDGDTDPAAITINVDDDTPVLSNVQAGPGVDVDETDAGTPAGFPISDTSANAVISATAAFGADGPAAVNATVYGLAITGGPDSGLATAIGNFAITLVQIDGDTIQGQYQDGGTQVAFTIQMNANGTVTLTQNVPLEHLVDGGTPADYNDTLDLSGLINATITITDGDGDSASAAAPIGDNLVFFDDGPNAQVDVEAALDTLVLDETRRSVPKPTATATRLV
jgi:T1SS-143 domain-containing protein